MRYERGIVLTSFLGSAPAALTAVVLVFCDDFRMPERYVIGAVLVSSALVPAYVLHRRIASRLRTFSRIIIMAMGMEDPSLRGHSAVDEEGLGDLGEVVVEINALARLMESHTVTAVEGVALLRTVLATRRGRLPSDGWRRPSL